MKHFHHMKLIYIISLLILALSGCGGTNTIGGTETGSTNFDTTGAAAKINAVSASLIPQMTSTSDSNITTSFLTNGGTSTQWDTWLETDNQVYLTDVFGSADDDPAPVTRVRVLLATVQSTISDTLSTDPSIACTGKSTIALLNEGATVTIPFFGSISNGDSDNRFFDCIIDEQSTNDSLILYGQDGSGVFRMVSISDSTSANSEETSTRGDTTQLKQVFYVTYGETTENNETVAYIDIQYAHSTIYNGVDDIFATSDDVTFKSRSRITGRVTLDSDGNPSIGRGEFTITKYDSGVNEDDSTWNATTRTIGRGGFGNEEYALLDIDSDREELSDASGIFCLQNTTSGLPAFAEESNCSSYETAVTWNENTFPFVLEPAIEHDFESKSYYNGNDTDLIASDGSNFTIPTYSSLPSTTSSDDEDINTNDADFSDGPRFGSLMGACNATSDCSDVNQFAATGFSEICTGTNSNQYCTVTCETDADCPTDPDAGTLTCQDNGVVSICVTSE